LAIGLGFIMTASTLAGLWLLTGIAGDMREEVTGRNRLIAMTLANDINTFLNGYKLSLGLLGAERFRTQAGVDALERLYPAFGTVFTVDRAGRVDFASASSKERYYDVSMRDFYIETERTRLPFLSSTFIAEGDYAPTAVLVVPYAGGMAVGYLNLAALSEYIGSLPVLGSETIAIVDRNGYYVAHADARRIIERETIALEEWFRGDLREVVGSRLVDRPDGSAELVSWSPVGQNSGWTIVVTEPAGQVFSGVDYVRTAMSLVLLTVWVLSMLLMVFVLYSFDTDIRSLRRYTEAIASGTYDAQFAYAGFKDLAPLAADFAMTVTAVRDREASIQENRRWLERLLDFMPVPAIVVGGDGSIALFNKAMTSLLGWTIDDIWTVDAWWTVLYPDDTARAAVMSYWSDYFETLRTDGPAPRPFEGSIVCKDGSTKFVMGDAAIIGDSVVKTLVDVSAARESEARTAASLKEKEILLKEIHHRVKNNLQLVISLLTLKANAPGSLDEAFSESIDRIRVMASIHELLYESKNFAHIDLGEYVSTIVDWILSSYAYGPSAPRLRLDLADIELNIDSAVPCGLIINELFTNAIKYAFGPENPDPTILVSTSVSADDYITLVVADNGVGIPENIDPLRVETLGMQLIVSLAAQLHGTWSLSRDGGSTWTIRFPR